jgi:hypothetical protein
MSNKITGTELAKHNSRESCWIVVHGKVYDVTEFLDGAGYPTFFIVPTLTSLFNSQIL